MNRKIDFSSEEVKNVLVYALTAAIMKHIKLGSPAASTLIHLQQRVYDKGKQGGEQSIDISEQEAPPLLAAIADYRQGLENLIGHLEALGSQLE